MHSGWLLLAMLDKKMTSCAVSDGRMDKDLGS